MVDAVERTSPSGGIQKSDVSAGLMAAFLGTAGVGHFVNAEFFDAIVPPWLPGSARFWTYVSGVVELTVAGLLVPRRTRRRGGQLAMVTFLGVWPANIWAAVDGGMDGLDPPFDEAWVAWLRVPFQIPMLLWARSIARIAD